MPSSRNCSGCGILRYCSEKCQKSDRSHEQLCPQMAMLQRLVSVDFRSFSSHFSFASWADELHVKPKETAPQILEVPPEEVSLEVPTPAPSERVPAAEDLCNLLDSVVDGELAEAIQRVEEALQESRLNELCTYGTYVPSLMLLLQMHTIISNTKIILTMAHWAQEKDADGSLMITKNSGRNKLQNKLKRAKGRLAKMESKEPVLAPVEDVGIVESKIEEAIPEYEEHPTGSLDASKSIGVGCIDHHGYHGVDWLPSWADLSYRGWHKCRKFSHLFLSYPKSIQSPSEHWCTNINPTAFCSLSKFIPRRTLYNSQYHRTCLNSACFACLEEPRI